MIWKLTAKVGQLTGGMGQEFPDLQLQGTQPYPSPLPCVLHGVHMSHVSLEL